MGKKYKLDDKLTKLYYLEYYIPINPKDEFNIIFKKCEGSEHNITIKDHYGKKNKRSCTLMGIIDETIIKRIVQEAVHHYLIADFESCGIEPCH
jgi:hypothetical protein